MLFVLWELCSYDKETMKVIAFEQGTLAGSLSRSLAEFLTMFMLDVC